MTLTILSMRNLNFAENSRFLLVRPDKIGDLVLALPALAALRQRYPQSFIGFLCSSYAASVLENNPDVNAIFLSDDPNLAQKIKQEKFDAAIHFYVENKTVYLTWKAAIPVRVGPFSKIASLLLTHRVRQNRSKVEKHEAVYNWDLVRSCGAQKEPVAPKIYLTEQEIAKAKELRQTLNLGDHPIFIHPGSAGSALRWPVHHFIELGRQLAMLGQTVVFTAGKEESAILDKVRAIRNPNVRIIPAGSLTLREFISVISVGKLFISNSTGPLHMASALSVPTLAFYPNLPIQTSAKRWSPFGRPQVNRVLSPELIAMSMESISVERAGLCVKGMLGI